MVLILVLTFFFFFTNNWFQQYVFRENNTDSAGDEIDLHGLYVKGIVP